MSIDGFPLKVSLPGRQHDQAIAKKSRSDVWSTAKSDMTPLLSPMTFISKKATKNLDFLSEECAIKTFVEKVDMNQSEIVKTIELHDNEILWYVHTPSYHVSNLYAYSETSRCSRYDEKQSVGLTS
jgi:hypothetical protein